MSDIRLSLGGDYIVPPDSDITIKIDYKDEGSAARVFDLAASIIRSFEELDRVLVKSVDSKISTTLVLEDVEKASLKVFLRNFLEVVDDQALRELDWKPQVGKYLVKAKYIALEWLDRDIKDGEPAQIEDLTSRFQRLAAESDVRHLPDYAPINPSRLAQPLDELQRVKSQFRPGERLTITLDRSEYEVDLEKQWLPSEHMPVGGRDQELSNDADMVLVIRKPDFLARSQWQFKHGKSYFSAPIEDAGWLEDFQRGTHPLRPGDALRVRVRFDYRYDEKGDLADQKSTIIKVYGIIHAPGATADLFVPAPDSDSDDKE